MIDNTSSRSGVNIARALDDQPPIHLLLPYIDERNSKSRVANDLGTLKKKSHSYEFNHSTSKLFINSNYTYNLYVFFLSYI